MTNDSKDIRKDASGFTVVELLITLALASVLLAIAIPSFNSFAVSNRLTTQANDVVAAVHFARSEAIKRNSPLSFCRAASATATVCAGAADAWEHWIVRTSSGVVARRSPVSTYGGAIVVRSTLANDEVAFGSDGLARTGGVLVNNRTVSVCATTTTNPNIRRVTMGAGSRLSTETLSGAC